MLRVRSARCRPGKTLAAALRISAAGGLILLMAAGSIVLWIGVPVGWLYLASHMTVTTQPSLGPYLLIIFAMPASMVLFARLLFRLDAVFGRLTGRPPQLRVRAPWLKSLRAERPSQRRLTVLEVLMIISVSMALIAIAGWFLLFAGDPLPP